MAKKYDTNPLDKDVLHRAEILREDASTEENLPEHVQRPTAFFESETRQFSGAPTVEMPTQRFAENPVNDSYHSVFSAPQSFSAPVNSSVSSAAQKLVLPPTSRRVLGLGLPENVAMLLPYLPMQLGAIAAVIELFFVARTETRVRFHAAQALALHLASWIIGIFLTFLGEFLPFAGIGSRIFAVTVFVYFCVSLFRVWKGKPNHIEALDDVTDFLNEKISRKSQPPK